MKELLPDPRTALPGRLQRDDVDFTTHGSQLALVVLLSLVSPPKKAVQLISVSPEVADAGGQTQLGSDLWNQQELEHCQLPGAGAPEAVQSITLIADGCFNINYLT